MHKQSGISIFGAGQSFDKHNEMQNELHTGHELHRRHNIWCFCLTSHWIGAYMCWTGTSNIAPPPPYRLFGDAILLCNSSREEVERKLQEWRRAMDERGLNIRRRNTD